MSEEQERATKKTWRQVLRRAPETSDGGPHRSRRRLVVAAVIVVAVGVLVVLPGYVASQPKFLERYANLKAPYRTWSTSVHAEASCQECHVRPGVVPQTGYSARMVGEFYAAILSRSRKPRLFGKPTNEACRSCHPDWRTVSPTGDLKIPHRAHVVVLKLKCIQCHEYLVHEKSPEGKHKPRMAACLTCHNGRRAKNACSTCHTQKAAPTNHRAKDWVIVHAEKQKELDCTKCHGWTANWCAECHARRPASHVAKWRSKHGSVVKSRRNCEACHDAAFCIRCHGEVPKLNFDPGRKLVR